MKEKELNLMNLKMPVEKMAKKPSEEVENFIVEMNLIPILPPEFEALDKAQKVKVIRDLKQRIVDIVKSDAQTQYSEDLKSKTTTGIKKIAGSIKGSFTKERDIKSIEKKIFEEIKNTPEGEDLIRQDLMRLTEMTKDKKISINENGKPEIVFINPNEASSEVEKTTIANFNIVANNFREMPYEWGQEKSGKHKKDYERAKTEYEEARWEILRTKAGKETPENESKALLEVLQVDNAIQMEQLLNTHPEFEKTLDDFTKSGDGKDIWKNFANTITGKNWINRGLIAGGFGGRMLARGAAFATGATMCTALGAPIVGGIIGGIRGRIRGKETLQERQKESRHGQKDKSKEKAKMVDIAPLIGGLEKMANEVEKATTDEERAKKLAKLAVVIDYSQDQIEKGQVNFGDAKSILANQFNFVNNLNRALVLEEMNRKDINEELRSKIEKSIQAKGEEVTERISGVQRKFITKQMWKGVGLGAGLASAGYVLRYAGETMGWWGNRGAGKVFTFEASNPKAFLNPLPPDVPVPKLPGVEPGGPASDSSISAAGSPETPPAINNFTNEGIKFENGKGGIQGILDLKKQILAQYNGDYSKAPESVQNFMDTDATKQATKLGLFDPKNPDGKESALIATGSVLKFDEQGNLLFGKPDASGNIPVLEKYQGKMFDSDRSAGRNAGVASETTAPKHDPAMEQPESAPKAETSSESIDEKIIERDHYRKMGRQTDAETKTEAAPEPNTVEKARENVARAFDDSKTEKTSITDAPVEKTELSPQHRAVSMGTTVGVGTPIETGSKVGIGSEVSVGSRVGIGSEALVGNYGNRPEVLTFGENRYVRDAYGQYHNVLDGRRYFPELSQEDNLILEKNPAFADNSFDLSGKELMQVYKATLDDTRFLFNEPSTFSKLSALRADKVLEYANETNGDPAVKHLSDYLKMLKNFTGLEPKSGFLGIGAEMNQHYIIRSYQKLAEQGNLEVFQASLRK